jgi:hypothetical protein
MAIRRLNYTGRKRIRRGDVSISLYEKPGESATFEANLTRLSAYKLPGNASIFVEARLQTRWMRFAFGTVGMITPPVDRRLTEFDGTEGVVFSVKVTATAERQGKLLAEANRVPLRMQDEVEERRSPLLPVKSEEIGHEIFRIDFTGRQPVLLINRAAGDKDAMARSPIFKSLVYPAVLREILTRFIEIDGCDEVDAEGDDWSNRWLSFATTLPGVSGIPNDSAQQRDWIDEAVAAFSRQQHMLDHFIRGWQKGGA